AKFVNRSDLVHFREIGKNIYTLKEVVNEIRDKETKRRLAVLPYQLTFKEPFPEYIRQVTEFSKKTGDYPSLSATDIKVLALTCQLETEFVGSDHLKKEPERNIQVNSTLQHPEAPVNVVGFHLPSKQRLEKDYPKRDGAVYSDSASDSTNKKRANEQLASKFNSFQFWRCPLPNIEADLLDILKLQASCISGERQLGADQDQKELGEEDDGDDEDDADDDDDGGGWITPSNIHQLCQGVGSPEVAANVKVGCITTDFAMQNVLIQMRLHVISVNGMLIRQARNYILRCHACFKTTTNMTKVFCPNCGNKTLKKVAVTVNEDGSLCMHLSKNPKVLNPRGLRHSLPLPQGGKHARNPFLTEDQNFPQQRLSRKARKKTNVFDPNYSANASPFVDNDINSRAAQLNIRDNSFGAGRQRMNPNAATKKFVKKK
uniref:RNA-binding protein NOB1 n=1 Tax=Callorhinchus milii TaxID=7868 RepID=A0A4W3J9B5_CALMI